MVMEKANGVALLIELLKLGVSGARTGGLDGSTLACVAVTATNSLKDLAADSTNVQVRVSHARPINPNAATIMSTLQEARVLTSVL